MNNLTTMGANTTLKNKQTTITEVAANLTISSLALIRHRAAKTVRVRVSDKDSNMINKIIFAEVKSAPTRISG
jgi:hypothetical protein